jgi:subfamily B ATP-binding cassette protein MsbA
VSDKILITISLMSSHPLPIPNKRAKFKKDQFLKLAPRLLELLRPEVKNLSIGFLALTGASFLNLFFPYLVKSYVNENIGKVLSDNLIPRSISLFVLFIVQGYLFFLRHYHLQIVGLKITTNLKNLLFKKLQPCL